MALNEKQIKEWKNTLEELKLIDKDDEIVENVYGDYWKVEFHMKTQKKGNVFFTNEKFVFVSGFGLDNLAIKYSDIKSIDKCNISLFLPTGIKITATDPDNGKDKSYIISVMKRDKWIELLNSKCGK